MIRAVIFDLDDTLISERKYVESGYKHISKLIAHDLNMCEENILARLMNLFSIDTRYVFNRLYEQLNHPYTADKIRYLVNQYRCHIPDIEYLDDVYPFMEYLKRKNMKTGIITDGYVITQRRKLDSLDAYDYFDAVIMTDELGREYWKPHPLAFEIMKKRLEVEYHEMMYIGDNPNKDFYIKRIQPIHTVRIMRDGLYTNACYFEGIKADYTINSLAEMEDIISSLNCDV